jgi:hypothetical protein
MSILDAIGKILPGIATSLGGPAAGAAVSFLSEKLLGKKDGTQAEVLEAFQGLTPEQQLKVKEWDFEFSMAQLKAESDSKQGQIAINLEEAKSSSIFNSGWRPFIGWVCGFSLAYAAVFDPFIRFVAQVIFAYNGIFPIINTEITLQVLVGILGLGGYRTYEKVKGTK